MQKSNVTIFGAEVGIEEFFCIRNILPDLILISLIIKTKLLRAF